jgi:hypothetical protein
MEEEKKDTTEEGGEYGLDLGSCDCAHCHHHCFDGVEGDSGDDEEKDEE